MSGLALLRRSSFSRFFFLFVVCFLFSSVSMCVGRLCVQILGMKTQCDVFVICILPNSPWSTTTSGSEARDGQSRKTEWCGLRDYCLYTTNCACAWSVPVPVPTTENHIFEFCQIHSSTTQASTGQFCRDGTSCCGREKIWIFDCECDTLSDDAVERSKRTHPSSQSAVDTWPPDPNAMANMNFAWTI